MPIALAATLRARAYKKGYMPSAVAGEEYTFPDTTALSYRASGNITVAYSGAVDGQYGRYYFDLVAEDNTGNRPSAPTGSGDCRTVYGGVDPCAFVNILML